MRTIVHFCLVGILWFVFLNGLVSKARAAHAPGSEITYNCTATPGIFEVHLIFYKDCSGLALCAGTCGAPCSQTIGLYGVDSSYASTLFGTVTVSLISVRDVDAKPYCPTAKSPCTNMGCITPGTFTPGFERYEFVGTVNLGPTSGIPAACCNVRLTWSLCCRSTDINTGSADEAIYNHAIINRCYSVSPCNSSPAFTRDPIIALNGGDNFVYNPGVIDPEMDSLSYAFAPALTSFGGSVTYIPPFSYDKPLPWTVVTGVGAGIRMDPLFGDIYFTPPNAGVNFKGVMVTEVKQWKKINGVPTVIGIIRRDVEAVIMWSAPNTPPRLFTNPPEGGNVYVPKTQFWACEGEQLCFTVTAKDTDFNPPIVSDTTFLSWDSALASMGGTFSPDYLPNARPREDRYRFCWTPPAGSGRTNPYYFSVASRDTRCPSPGRLSRAFAITVNPKPQLQITSTIVSCGQLNLAYTNTNPEANILKAEWQIANAPDDSTFTNGYKTYSPTSFPLTFTHGGRYHYKLIVRSGYLWGACINELVSFIDIPNRLIKDSIVSTNTTCFNQQDGTIGVYSQLGFAPYQYKLNNLPYTSSQHFDSLASGTYLVWIKDNFQCEVLLDTITINAPEPILAKAIITPPTCHNDSNAVLYISADGGSGNLVYSINQLAPQTIPNFNNLASGSYAVTVTDSLGCSNNSTVVIPNPPSIVSTIVKMDPTCPHDSSGIVLVSETTGKQPVLFSLNNGPYQSSAAFVNLPAGVYSITTRDSNQCENKEHQIILQNPPTMTLTPTIVQPTCFGKNDGSLTVVVTHGKAPYSYQLNSQSPQLAPSFSGLAAGNYVLTIIDSFNCVTSDSVTIHEPAVVAATSQRTNITCYDANDGKLIVLPTGGTPPYSVIFDSITYSAPLVIQSIKPGTYTYTVYDNHNCFTSLSDTFKNPAPIAAGIITGDSIVATNTTYQYSIAPQANTNYQWFATGGNIVTGANGPTVTVEWNTIGTQSIRVQLLTIPNGCEAESSLDVQVGSTGLSEWEKTYTPQMYPNPTSDIVNLVLKQLPDNGEIRIYNAQGKLLLKQELKLQQQINLEQYPSGMYLLQIGGWNTQIIKD